MHSSISTLITDQHPHDLRALLALLSVFSPQSRNGLKRAVDDCEQLAKANHVSKKEKLVSKKEKLQQLHSFNQGMMR